MHISLYVFVVGKEMDRMVTREEKVKRMKGSWEKNSYDGISRKGNGRQEQLRK